MRGLLITILVLISCGSAAAQIHRVAQMSTAQIGALDKQKTVVILTGGILEQHGPHLPSYSDTYINEWLTERLAEAIVERPGWSALIFPTIPLGYGGGNEIGGKYVFPGSYTVRRSTVRAVYMDLATELGEQGFRWAFINHGHGAPFNNLMLEQAGAYFRDIYGGRMVHLRGLEPTRSQLAKVGLTAPRPEPGAKERIAIGKLDPHAGFEETSVVLFLRPDLVDPIYKQLPPLVVNDSAQQFAIARANNWAGYLSTPHLATAAYGAARQKWRAEFMNSLALGILDGVLDEREIPTYAGAMMSNKEFMKEIEGSNAHEASVERRQLEWMKKNGID